MAGSIWLAATVAVRRYYTPAHQNFGSYFLVFRKCEVTPHLLYRNSLTLKRTCSDLPEPVAAMSKNSFRFYSVAHV